MKPSLLLLPMRLLRNYHYSMGEKGHYFFLQQSGWKFLWSIKVIQAWFWKTLSVTACPEQSHCRGPGAEAPEHSQTFNAFKPILDMKNLYFRTRYEKFVFESQIGINASDWKTEPDIQGRTQTEIVTQAIDDRRRKQLRGCGACPPPP